MSYKNGPKIVTDGLVLCLDAGNTKSYAGNGTTWSDLTKNGNSTMVNTPSFSSDGPKSFSFSGANGTYFSLTGNSAFKSMTNNVTLCAWCRQDNRYYSSTPHQTVLCTDAAYRGGLKLMSAYHNGGIGAWLANSNGTDAYMLNSDSIVEQGWKYICTTRDASTGLLTLYIDGVLKNSATTYTGETYTNQLAYVGSEYHSSGYYYYGRISSVLGYNRALSAAEILQNYNATKSKFQKYDYITSNLVFFANAGAGNSYSGTGTTWTDLGSGANNATLTNGPTFSGDGGGSIAFDAVDDYALLGSTITLGNGSWTVNALVNASGGPNGSFGAIFSNNSGGPVTNAFGINSNSGYKISYQNYDGTWNYHFGNTTLDLNTWYYLTWVNTSNTMIMYVNGVADCSSFSSTTSNGGPCNSIGRNWYGNYAGKIASLSYYNVAHTADQVMQNFKWAKYMAGIS